MFDYTDRNGEEKHGAVGQGGRYGQNLSFELGIEYTERGYRTSDVDDFETNFIRVFE